jgi:hypothetical protein
MERNYDFEDRPEYPTDEMLQDWNEANEGEDELTEDDLGDHPPEDDSIESPEDDYLDSSWEDQYDNEPMERDDGEF